MLRSRTEGWPAGLRLAAMSLDPADIEDGIARFSGNERSVADYLIGEVIERLPPEDRDFLLRTSITEKLTGDLADHLDGRTDSQQVLERLVGANAFVVALGGQQRMVQLPPAAAGADAAPVGDSSSPRRSPSCTGWPREWMARQR